MDWLVRNHSLESTILRHQVLTSSFWQARRVRVAALEGLEPAEARDCDGKFSLPLSLLNGCLWELERPVREGSSLMSPGYIWTGRLARKE